MFRWNLDTTVKLAYALSTVTILFLSSAFISLAHAGEMLPNDIDTQFMGNLAPDETGMDYDAGELDKNLMRHQWNQQKYIEQWERRKSTYRLYEEYAAWLRDHKDPGGGFFGPQGAGASWEPYSPFMPTLQTFVDIMMSLI
jgi:hypothetical protein